MSVKKFKIEFTVSSRRDMREMKKYILKTFKYRELGENFTRRMKKATEGLKTLPTGFDTIGIQYRGYDIYMKPYHTYLFLYIVDEEQLKVTILRVFKDGMNWQYILKRWLKYQQ